MTFEIVDMPTVKRDKHRLIVSALIALPPGKSIRAPLDMFGKNPAANLGMRARCGRKLHCRKMPDGWYLWLEAVPETNGNGAT